MPELNEKGDKLMPDGKLIQTEWIVRLIGSKVGTKIERTHGRYISEADARARIDILKSIHGLENSEITLYRHDTYETKVAI